MGVPGAFTMIIKEYHSSDPNLAIIKGKIAQLENPKLNNLYLDFNAALYQVLKPQITTESALIANTLGYLDTLVKIVAPVNLLYLALDGVPCRAKIEQQRMRRFHSVNKKNRAANLNRQYGDLTDNRQNFHLDTNMISPGTAFMSDLAKALKDHVANHEIYQHVNKIVITDSSIPNEGEHKIMKYIKENSVDGDLVNTFIYGLDADLIFLSMASHQPNIFLLREAAQFGQFAELYSGIPFLFLEIDNLITLSSSISKLILGKILLIILNLTDLLMTISFS